MALGVLAFGDSITNGGGELQWGVALQSWALWTAGGLGLPYTGNAIEGARGTRGGWRRRPRQSVVARRLGRDAPRPPPRRRDLRLSPGQGGDEGRRDACASQGVRQPVRRLLSAVAARRRFAKSGLSGFA